jgi:hypothetical protein
MIDLHDYKAQLRDSATDSNVFTNQLRNYNIKLSDFMVELRDSKMKLLDFTAKLSVAATVLGISTAVLGISATVLNESGTESAVAASWQSARFPGLSNSPAFCRNPPRFVRPDLEMSTAPLSVCQWNGLG